MQHLAQDIRHAGRALRRSPGYTAAALATLALGVGVNTAVFSLLYALALAPLPLPAPERVVNVFQEIHGRSSRRIAGSPYRLSYPELRAYRDRAHTLAGLAGYAEIDLTLGGGEAAPLAGQLVTCDYFRVLGVAPVLGRGFTAEECGRPGDGRVAVVSEGLWRRRLAADPAALGRPLVLDGESFTIVGVAAPGFAGTALRGAEVWLPVSQKRHLLPGGVDLADDNVSWLAAIGRLSPGATPAAARADLATTARWADAAYPGRATAVSVERGSYFNGPEARGTGAVAAAAVVLLAGLALAMAAVNVLGLQLARAAARRHELGVRLALGAGRRRLVAQMATEGVLLAFLGGVAGLLPARWLPPLLLAVVPEQSLRLDFAPDLRVLAFALFAALGCAAVCTAALAVNASRCDPLSVLRGSRAGGREGGSRLRLALIGAQVAGSLLLLVVAGLLARSLARAQTLDPGYATAGVVTLAPGLDPGEEGTGQARAAAYYRELERRVAAEPGVESVALAAVLPLAARSTTTVTPDGGGAELAVATNVVSGSYFTTLRIPVVAGRAFVAGERQAGGEVPAVVSASFARQLSRTSGGALGRGLVSGRIVYRVVGIAADVRSVSLARPDGPFLYAAADPEAPRGLKLVVRMAGWVRGDRAAKAADLARAARAVDRHVLVTAEPLPDVLDRALAPARLAALLCAVLGALAAALAVVGVYGLVDYGVRRRTREIGVRVALGASSRSVLALVLREALAAVAVGAAIGLPLAAAGARLVRGLLFGLSPLDPLAYLGTTALLAAAAGLALLQPARRAARTDPASALRHD